MDVDSSFAVKELKWEYFVDGQQVPEAATLALFGLGLAGLRTVRRGKLRT